MSGSRAAGGQPNIRELVSSPDQRRLDPMEGATYVAVTKASLWQALKNIATLGMAARKKK